MRLSHETGDRRFFHRGTLPTRKSPVSWENLMSHTFSINPMRKSHETWNFLMRQETGYYLLGAPYEKIFCLKRKSNVSCILKNSKRKCHETWDYLMRHKKIFYLTRKSHVSSLLYKSHENISWDMRLSHETEDRIFSHRGPSPQENLLSHEKTSCLMPSP